jgi:membrane protease YdiL (CAAX protease family)
MLIRWKSMGSAPYISMEKERVKDFIVKHQLALFAVLTLCIGWFWWAQMALGLWPMEYIIIPSSLGGISPILTLVILQKLSARRVDLGGIVKTAKVGRIQAHWLIVAAFSLPIMITIGNALSFLFGFESALNLLNPDPATLGWALFAIVPITFFPGLLTSPLFEEPGWRGFALPKLQAMYGRELGSLLIGSYWWLWHQMSNIAFGLFPSVIGYAYMLGQSFSIDSMFNLSKRNLLVAMFAHQSLFIAFTYLYDTQSDLSAIVLAAAVWMFVIVLRLMESRRGYPDTLSGSIDVEPTTIET